MLEIFNGIMSEIIDRYSVDSGSLVIELISSGIMVATVFLGNVITLRINNKNIRLSKRQFSESLKLQEKQFNKSMNEQEKIFLLNKKSEEEKQRISIMPYLVLDDTVKLYHNEEKVFFPIKFENCGSGTAVGMSLVTRQLMVYYDKAYDMEYYQCEKVDKQAIRVGECAQTMLECKRKGGALDVIFEVEFEDMMQRKYRQKFRFVYNIEKRDTIQLHNYSRPECV